MRQQTSRLLIRAKNKIIGAKDLATVAKSIFQIRFFVWKDHHLELIRICNEGFPQTLVINDINYQYIYKYCTVWDKKK